MEDATIISSYTSDQAIEDGYLVKIADDVLITTGVFEMKGKGFDSVEDDYLFEPRLLDAMRAEYEKQPDKDTRGGNDKDFFTMEWRSTKFFVARNEKGGLTIMLPEEY